MMLRPLTSGRISLPRSPTLVRPARRHRRAAHRGPHPRITAMSVIAHADGWALRVDGLDEPAWVVPQKARALASATDAAREHRASLRVFSRAGRLQRTLDFRS